MYISSFSCTFDKQEFFEYYYDYLQCITKCDKTSIYLAFSKRITCYFLPKVFLCFPNRRILTNCSYKKKKKSAVTKIVVTTKKIVLWLLDFQRHFQNNGRSTSDLKWQLFMLPDAGRYVIKNSYITFFFSAAIK